jgi:hypothetical protein
MKDFFSIAAATGPSHSGHGREKSHGQNWSPRRHRGYPLAKGEVILYNFTSEPRTKTVLGAAITLPPNSLRSVLAMRPAP